LEASVQFIDETLGESAVPADQAGDRREDATVFPVTLIAHGVM
jgi:hypothetical protein